MKYPWDESRWLFSHGGLADQKNPCQSQRSLRSPACSMCVTLLLSCSFSLVLAHIYSISTDGIWLHLIHSSLWWRAVITLLKMGTIVMLPCCSQVDTPQTHSLSLEKHSPFPANLTANKLQSQPLPIMPDGCLVHHWWSHHCWLEGLWSGVDSWDWQACGNKLEF